MPPALAEGLRLFEGIEDFWLASEAYVFGYPLVTMEMTRRVVTNVPAVQGTRGPMGHVIKLRQYPDSSFRDVTAPNADTLYTTSFFDVGREPMVLSLPDMKGRYALFPMLDGWTTVFQVPGKRTTGTGPQTYAITGPGWSGTLPPGVIEYKSRTGIVWLLGRIYCTARPRITARCMPCRTRFRWCRSAPMAGPIRRRRPGRSVHRHAHRGARAGEPHERGGILHAARTADEDQPARAGRRAAHRALRPHRPGARPGFRRIEAARGFRQPHPGRLLRPHHDQFRINAAVRDVNGWGFTTRTGTYGTDYLMRALVTAIGLGANRPQDAVYPTSLKDADGQEYTGANRYVMRFPPGQLPPVEGFWSLTMYDADYFFVANRSTAIRSARGRI